VVEGARGSILQVFGDKLFYVEGNALKSIDLMAPGAAPVILNTVEGILAYDAEHVVYKDETSVYSLAVGAADATSAVTLRAADSIYGVAIAGNRVFLSSRAGVYSVGVDGTAPADVVPDDSFAFIEMVASDGTNVYFDDGDVLKIVPAAGGEPRSIGVSGPDLLFDNTASFAKIFPAGDIVHWVDDGETYGWTALDGTRCGILGTHDAFFSGGGTLAETYLYASGDATIYRAERAE